MLMDFEATFCKHVDHEDVLLLNAIGAGYVPCP